jgi:hypothetical protein
MHPPLDEWDEQYLRQLATPDESLDLEKKGADLMDPGGNGKRTRDELAKQVCAFSNSGDGFLVYGVADTGGFDAGVSEHHGRQPIKAWVEQTMPTMLNPPVHRCQARFIPVSGVHAMGRGVLVVFVPLSEARPHWVPEGSRDRAYIRAGEHSFEMRHQTLLDIASRGVAGTGEVEDLNVIAGPEQDGRSWRYLMNPKICLHSGPVVENWNLELSIPHGEGVFISTLGNAQLPERNVIVIGPGPALFPRRAIRVADAEFRLVVTGAITDALAITTILSLGSGLPVQQRFLVRDLKARQ